MSMAPLAAALALLAAGAESAPAAPPQREGQVVFFDVAGPDRAKLRAFYTGALGWAVDPNGGIKTPAMDGVIRQDPPETLIYVAVTDINQTLARITAAGGQVVLGRTVVPNVVVFALFKDPAGNRMGLVEIARAAPASASRP